MTIDIKIESARISLEIISGSVEQACEDYKNVLDNYRFITSAPMEKSYLNSLGTLLARQVRKQPDNFLKFCTSIWSDSFKDGKEPVGSILAALQALNPDLIISETIKMCRKAKNTDDVDILVSGFEPVILRDPHKYFPLLKSCIDDDDIWVKRLVIVTIGHIMFRHKKEDITTDCLELLRNELSNESEPIRKATSWIIGSYGVRADQNAVALFMKSFADCENPVVVWNFTEVFRRSKISIQKEVSDILIPLFEKWSASSNDNISQSANSALRILQK